MLSYTVYGFGDIYQTQLILNGIKHFLGSSAWTSLVYSVLIVALVLAILKVKQFDLFYYLRGIAIPFLLFVVLFSTPVKLNFYDTYTFEVGTVSNVPFGIGFPLYFSSLIEKAMLDVIDDYVSPPSTPKFSEVDYFGHVRLMMEVASSNLWTDSHLQQTVTKYIENCTIAALVNGHLSSVNIKQSTDLETTLAYASKGIFTEVYRSNGSFSVETCAAAYAALSGNTSDALTQSINSPLDHIRPIFGRKGVNKALMGSAVDTIATSLFTGQQDAKEALFKQNLYINAIQNTLGKISPDMMATFAQAETNQFSSASTAALMYIKQLPKLRNMFKLTLVAMFPLVGAFFLLQSGAPFVYWFGSLFWVSLWLPIQASIHAAYAAQTISDLKSVVGSTGGYSLANAPQITKWATETTAIAGGLMIIVPALSAKVLTWITPKIGSGIMGLMQASRGHQQMLSGASSGAVDGAMQTTHGLLKDRFRTTMMDYGDVNTGTRKDVSEYMKEQTSGAYQSLYGEQPIGTTFAARMDQESGAFMMQKTWSAAEEQAALANETITQQRVQSTARTAGLAMALNDLSKGGIVNSDASSYGLTENLASNLSNTQAQVMQLLNSNSGTKTWTEEDKNQLAAGLAGKFTLGGSVLGGDLQGAVDASVKHVNSATSSDSVSESYTSSNQAQSAENLSQSRAKAIAQENRLGFQAAITNENGKSTSYTDAIQSFSQAQTAHALSVSRADSIRAASGAGGTSSVNVNQQIGQLTSLSDMDKLRDSSSSLNDYLLNGGTNLNEARQLVKSDFLKSYNGALKGDAGAAHTAFGIIRGLQNAHASAGRGALSGAKEMEVILSEQLHRQGIASGSLGQVAESLPLIAGRNMPTSVAEPDLKTPIGHYDGNNIQIRGERQGLEQRSDDALNMDNLKGRGGISSQQKLDMIVGSLPAEQRNIASDVMKGNHQFTEALKYAAGKYEPGFIKDALLKFSKLPEETREQMIKDMFLNGSTTPPDLGVRQQINEGQEKYSSNKADMDRQQRLFLYPKFMQESVDKFFGFVGSKSK